MSVVATSNLLGLDRYLFILNCLSSSSNCWEVNAVLGRRVLPISEFWACAGKKENTSVDITLNYLSSLPFYFLNFLLQRNLYTVKPVLMAYSFQGHLVYKKPTILYENKAHYEYRSPTERGHLMAVPRLAFVRRFDCIHILITRSQLLFIS